MFFKLLQWALLLGLLYYTASTLISLLPFVLFIVAVVIALCCVYALFPIPWRLPTLEIWLYPDWEPPSRSPPYSPFSPSHPSTQFPSFPPFSSYDNLSPHGRDPPASTHFHQPTLDFESVASVRGKFPSREQLLTFLKSQVIGQDKAIEALGRVLFSKLGSQNSSKPLVILLLGTTGTGKTELTKAVANGLNTQIVRFDMGEYADSFKSSNLLGSAKGYVSSEEGGALPNALRESKKIHILLFDEVEKAHPSLWRQLLAFFDEGVISDTLGSVIAPKNTICLLTSNLVAEKIALNPEKAKDILREANCFPPEFIGRIDKCIALPRLNKADSARLTVQIAKKVASDYGIALIIEQEAMNELVTETFEEGEKYGGRGIRDKVLDLLGDDFLDLQGGDITQARLIMTDGKLRAVALG